MWSSFCSFLSRSRWGSIDKTFRTLIYKSFYSVFVQKNVFILSSNLNYWKYNNFEIDYNHENTNLNPELKLNPHVLIWSITIRRNWSTSWLKTDESAKINRVGCLFFTGMDLLLICLNVFKRSFSRKIWERIWTGFCSQSSRGFRRKLEKECLYLWQNIKCLRKFNLILLCGSSFWVCLKPEGASFSLFRTDVFCMNFE